MGGIWEVALGPDGDVSFRGIPPLVAHYLLGIPDCLSDDPEPAVRDRLAPAPEDDAERRAEWERLMVPELFALVASARTVVEQDLALLKQTSGIPGHGRLDIPAAHVDAWLHALQVARLTIGATHGLVSGDLDDWPPPEEDPERSEAILRVSILGEVQGLLVDVGSRHLSRGEPGVADHGQEGEQVFDVSTWEPSDDEPGEFDVDDEDDDEA